MDSNISLIYSIIYVCIYIHILYMAGSDFEINLYQALAAMSCLSSDPPFSMCEQIGSGACASVYRAVYLPTLSVVAVKYFPIHDQGRRRQVLTY